VVELSLDFDDDNLDKFVPALEKLHKLYEDVQVRKSANRGWHIWVKGVDFRPDEELALREELGDCAGRTEGDYARLHSGFKTSRLFKAKGRIIRGQKEVKVAGEWMSYDEWKKAFGETEDVRGKVKATKEGEEESPSQAKEGRDCVSARRQRVHSDERGHNQEDGE
jgi:hypothetical protein